MPASTTEATDRDDGNRSRGQSSGEDRGRSADKPSQIPAKGWKDIAKRVWAQRGAKHTQLLAAGVAFWAFLSLFPAIIAAITIFGLIMSPEEVTRQMEGFLTALPADARAPLETQMENLAGTTSTALGVGLVVSILSALWAASGAMGSLMEAINVVYDETDDRNFFKKRGIAVLLTVGAILFVGLTLVGITVVPHLLEAVGLGGPAQVLLSAAVWPILAAGFIAGMAILYRYAPDRADAEWRWVSGGAVTALVIWVVASILFQVYVGNFGNYNKTYGALAAVVILLLWLMITNLSILMGAHVNAEMEAQTARDTTTDPDEPMGQRQASKADNLGPVDDQIGDDNGNGIDLRDRDNQQTEEHAR